MADVQTGFASVNGAQLYYDTAGSGQPLVMVHAGIANSQMWDDQFQLFASRYRVVRFDMRGFGKSAPVAGEFYLYQDLKSLLDFLKIERAILMGCSKGGGTVVDFALAYPQQAAALITVGSSPSGFEFDAQPPRQWDEIVATFESGNLERCAELE